MDDWEQHAACKHHDDPDLFFDGSPDAVKAAVAVCHTCPVWEHCLLANMHEQVGVWGCSERCRRRVRKLRNQGATRSRLLALARSSNEQTLGGLAANLVPQGKLVTTVELTRQ